MTEPRRYRRRPHDIEAIRYDGNNIEPIVEFLGGPRMVKAEPCALPGPGRGTVPGLAITTIEGPIFVQLGGYVWRDEDGVVGMCSEQAFDSMYEAVTE